MTVAEVRAADSGEHSPIDHSALIVAGPQGRTRAISNAELDEMVAARETQLSPTGRRQLVLVAGRNQLDVVVSYLAARAGNHPVVLADELTGAIVDRYQPDVIIGVDAGGEQIERRESETARDLHPDLALLLSTSGSTGDPRLVRLSQRNLDSNAQAIAQFQRLSSDDRGVTSLPLHYCYGLSVLNAHRAVGASIVLTDLSVVDDCFWDMLEEHGVTNLAGVPHTFELIERGGIERLQLERLRLVTQAGGRMPPESVRRVADAGRRFGWDFVVMYGQTEATARMAYLPADLVADHPDRVGVAVPGGTFEIHPCPELDLAAGVGEVVYRGPNVMMGYAESVSDLGRGHELEMLVTGDLGRIDDKGLLQIVGRRNRFAKIFGLRIDLANVESRLAERGVVALCASDDARLLVAVERPVPTACDELISLVTSLPPRSIEVVPVDSLPRLPNGKPDVQGVFRLAATTSVATTSVANLAAANDVPSLFAEVLRVDRVAPHDTFTSLGGDSFSYVEASIRLEQLLGFVPSGWHVIPVSELGDLRPNSSRRWLAGIETSVVLRAMAIVAIVVTHMRIARIPAGAHILLAVVGFNFARFQLPRLLAASGVADYVRKAATPIGRLAAVTSAWIAVQMLISGGHGIPTLLLVNNYFGTPGHVDARWRYWFFEAIIQITLCVAVVLAVGPVRRLAQRQPFAAPMLLLVPAAMLRFEVVRLVDRDYNYVYRPDTIIWCFLLGWAAAVATGWRSRLAVTSAAAVLVLGYFHANLDRELRLLGAMLLLVWVPTVLVPRALARPIGVVASASMWIFMTHWIVWPALTPQLPDIVVLLVTLAFGVAAWATWRRIGAIWRSSAELFRLTERFRMVEQVEVCQNPPG